MNPNTSDILYKYAAQEAITEQCRPNSNCIFIALNLRNFIALNLHRKTDSRCTKQKKQRTIIINLRHSRSQRHGEISEKAEIRVDILVQRDRF